MPLIYSGKVYDIWFCKKTQKELEQIPDREVVVRRLTNLTNDWKRLADLGKQALSREHFPSESATPLVGSNSDKFYCFKRIPLRAYCWFSVTHENRVYISHFIHKKKIKLDSRDIEKASNNWRRVEQNGDED